jgi:hypothetical protein
MRSTVHHSRIAWTVLAIAMAASVALIAVEARNTAMQSDEWSYVYRLASQPLLPAIFNPPSGNYLVALPMLIYAGLLHTFGMASYLPYRIVGLALLLAADLLFFDLARRRIGPLAALPPAILLLFLGSGSELVVVPTRMPSQVALTAGLGMLIALERRDVRGDVTACVLLFVALLSHPLGIAFAAAALTSVALRPADERWRRWWIVVPPIALFALWWLTLHGSVSGGNSPSVGDVVSFSARSFIAVCAAAGGFFRAPWTEGGTTSTDYINAFSIALALLVLGAIVTRLAKLRTVPSSTWAALVAFAVAVVAPALAPGGSLEGLRRPDAPRYLYPDTLLLFLLGAELASGLRLRGVVRSAATTGVGVIFAVSMFSNVRLLFDSANDYEQRASFLKSELAGAERARIAAGPKMDVVPNDLDKDVAATALSFYLSSPGPLPPPALAGYYTVSDRFGTPAYTADELEHVSEPLRRQARLEFANALQLDRQSGG